MPVQCPECGVGAQLAHDDAGSLVCTRCGTLPDPAQAVLADHHGHPPTLHPAPRNARGWHLSQTKQDRDRKNMIAMGTFIGSVLSRLNNPGLSPRAEAIFTQAMAKGRYRWGRRAKLVAGASVAIALREARKSDSLHDIAFLLDDSSISLSRTFQAVVSLLDFSLASTDPATHLPILHALLQSVIHPESSAPSPASQLPKSLVTVLTSLSLHAAVRTASSLSQIISHHSPPLAITNLPTPPTACALLILGLEAEARAPLPHLCELARSLAIRFALAPGVVSSRYKFLYDLIEEWIRHVPWLDQFVYKANGRGAAARSKVPKRAIVAKGMKDVIQFHEEIRQGRMQQLQKVNVDLEPDPGDGSVSEGEGDDVHSSAPTAAPSSSKRTGDLDMAQPPRKRRKGGNKCSAVQAAYQFLRDPLSSGSLDVTAANGQVGEVSLLTHILTCSPDELSRARGIPPTRLQLLAAARGGSTAEDIADEELFAKGELEGLLRDEREREVLWPLFQLNWGEETPEEEAATCHRRPVVEAKRGAKRIDMDALARILGDDVDGDGTDDDEDAYLWDPDDHAYGSSDTGGAELVSDWRPASPDGGVDDIFGAFHRTMEDRYDEEL